MTLPPLRADHALSAVRPVGTPPQAAGRSQDGASLDSVTIEAAKKRKELWRHASRFVSSVTFTCLYDSLARWDEPICPLVAGLPRKQGEYILGRITQVATAAQAPLAREHCRPNLYVVATPYPDLLLEKWWARDVNMYKECSGLGGVKAFLQGAPEGLSAWDRARLYALYHTPQGKPEVQGMLIRSSMVRQISSGH
jgi:hypothetical protein